MTRKKCEDCKWWKKETWGSYCSHPEADYGCPFKKDQTMTPRESGRLSGANSLSLKELNSASKPPSAPKGLKQGIEEMIYDHVFDSENVLKALEKTIAEIDKILKAWGMYKEYRNKVLKLLDSGEEKG